jgi:hypothetical protein
VPIAPTGSLSLSIVHSALKPVVLGISSLKPATALICATFLFSRHEQDRELAIDCRLRLTQFGKGVIAVRAPVA